MIGRVEKRHRTFEYNQRCVGLADYEVEPKGSMFAVVEVVDGFAVDDPDDFVVFAAVGTPSVGWGLEQNDWIGCLCFAQSLGHVNKVSAVELKRFVEADERNAALAGSCSAGHQNAVLGVDRDESLFEAKVGLDRTGLQLH